MEVVMSAAEKQPPSPAAASPAGAAAPGALDAAEPGSRKKAALLAIVAFCLYAYLVIYIKTETVRSARLDHISEVADLTQKMMNRLDNDELLLRETIDRMQELLEEISETDSYSAVASNSSENQLSTGDNVTISTLGDY